MAVPASTYSVAIEVLLSRVSGGRLRARLGRPVEASLVRYIAVYDDRPGQPPALVVARRRAVPVVPGPIELERGGSTRMVHQPYELGVAVARQDRAVRVLVIVEELELEHPPMGHHQDRGLIHQLVLRDPDGGVHLAVRPLLGVPDTSPAE